MKPIKPDQEELVKENFRYPKWQRDLVLREANSRIHTTTKSDIIREALSYFFSKRRKKG